eukprot:913696_1
MRDPHSHFFVVCFAFLCIPLYSLFPVAISGHENNKKFQLHGQSSLCFQNNQHEIVIFSSCISTCLWPFACVGSFSCICCGVAATVLLYLCEPLDIAAVGSLSACRSSLSLV